MKTNRKTRKYDAAICCQKLSVAKAKDVAASSSGKLTCETDYLPDLGITETIHMGHPRHL